MAKRDIKAVTASADVAAIIDRGADVDAQLKNLGFEDKGLKTKITDSARNQLDEGELSVRLLGKTSAAVVSGVEKVELDVGAEQFPQVRAAIDGGLLAGVVERSVSLVIPPGDVERAAVELRKAGIRATVTETLKVSADVLRDQMAPGMTGSVQEVAALHALAKCVKKDVSFRVKYERI